jgi:Na+-translocating ferredoxin:NAD+ oxidoreductase RnfC subunit
LGSEELIEIIRDKNISGKGGGAFSTAEKIERLLASKKESLTLIINGVECDPGLRHDKWIMENHFEAIKQTARLLSSKLALDKVVLARKKTKNEPDSAAGITTQYIPDYYPFGEERSLIKLVLNIEVPHDVYPADYGILILNVQTMYRIHAVLFEGVENPGHFLTLTNLKMNSAHVIFTEEGRSVYSIVNDLYPGEMDIYAGGGIMKSQKATIETIVNDRITSITISSPIEYSSNKCLECMQCVIHCPAGLDVKQIAEKTREFDFTKPENPAINTEKCIGCGSCNYVCPAGLNLLSFCRDYSEKHLSAANTTS